MDVGPFCDGYITLGTRHDTWHRSVMHPTDVGSQRLLNHWEIIGYRSGKLSKLVLEYKEELYETAKDMDYITSIGVLGLAVRETGYCGLHIGFLHRSGRIVARILFELVASGFQARSEFRIS